MGYTFGWKDMKMAARKFFTLIELMLLLKSVWCSITYMLRSPGGRSVSFLMKAVKLI